MFGRDRLSTTSTLSTDGRRLRWPSWVAILLAPLVLAGAFVWATWHADDRLGRVQAAIVNEDKPVTVNGQTVPLGRQLTAGLVEGAPDDPDLNLTWVLSDSDDASEGLASGRYAAVITIPENFSAAATSSAKPDDAEQATIGVQTSDITAIADSALTSAVSNVAVGTLNTTLTETYLDNIYLGFNSISKSFGTAADGAQDLADGAGQLADGVDQSATGTQKLATGLDQLSTGASKLSDGSPALRSGGTKISNGIGQLATQTTDLPQQSKDLAGGVRKIATGTKGIATGAKKLDTGASQLATGAKQNAAGATTYAAGVTTYRTAMAGIAKNGIVVGGQPYCPPELTAQAPPALAPQLCAAFAAGTQAGGAAALQGLDGTATQPGLVSGANQLAAGATQLSTGVTGVSSGVHSLSGGASRLAAGADQAADGTETFATGIGKLAKGIGTASTGLDSYVAGVASYSRGVDQIATGIQSSAGGTQKLADGLAKLSDGAGELATGTTKLADGLSTGAKKIPTYDEGQRERLSTAVATPVTTGGTGISLPELSSTSLLVALALFAGGLISFLVLRALPARSLTSSRPSWQLLLIGLAPAAVIGVVQAAVLTLIARFVLDLSASDTVGVLGLAVLAAVTFAAVSQALVIWAGDVGRLIGLAAVGLTAAGGIVSAVPEFFDAVRPFLPLTPLVDGIRALVTDGAGLGGQVGLLGLWLLLALVAGVVGVAKGRVLTPAKLAQLPALA